MEINLLRVLKDIMKQEQEASWTFTTGTYPGSVRQMIVRDAFRKEHKRLRRNKMLYALAEGLVLGAALAIFLWCSK